MSCLGHILSYVVLGHACMLCGTWMLYMRVCTHAFICECSHVHICTSNHMSCTLWVCIWCNCAVWPQLGRLLFNVIDNHWHWHKLYNIICVHLACHSPAEEALFRFPAAEVVGYDLDPFVVNRAQKRLGRKALVYSDAWLDAKWLFCAF